MSDEQEVLYFANVRGLGDTIVCLDTLIGFINREVLYGAPKPVPSNGEFRRELYELEVEWADWSWINKADLDKGEFRFGDAYLYNDLIFVHTGNHWFESGRISRGRE